MIVLRAYRLTTANIIYRRPDHLWLLQEFIWQEMDRVPGLPGLHRFLTFWNENLDGPIHTVLVADAELPLDDLIRVVDDTMTMQ